MCVVSARFEETEDRHGERREGGWGGHDRPLVRCSERRACAGGGGGGDSRAFLQSNRNKKGGDPGI